MKGITVDHYRIEGKLGSGGMGTVYRAVYTRLGRMVALKFVSAEQALRADAVERLRRERQMWLSEFVRSLQRQLEK